MIVVFELVECAVAWMIVSVDPNPRDLMPDVRARRAAAGRLCAHASARIASARQQLLHARRRLAAHAEFCAALARRPGSRASAAHDREVVALPLSRTRSPRTPDAEHTPAKVLAFVRPPQRSANEPCSPASAWASILREILWGMGEEDARPFVERALALVSASDDPELRGEADAMRDWLARR